MAHSEALKEEVKIYLQTHLEKPEVVAKRFGINKRTLYRWMKEEGWQVGKMLKGNRIEKLREEIGDEVLSQKKQEIKESLKHEIRVELNIEQSQNLISGLMNEDLVGSAADDLVMRAMGLEFLDEEQTKAMLIGRNSFYRNVANDPDNPDNLEYARKYASLVGEVKRSIHGRDEKANVIQIANINNMGRDEMSAMSDDELRRALELAKKDIGEE